MITIIVGAMCFTIGLFFGVAIMALCAMSKESEKNYMKMKNCTTCVNGQEIGKNKPCKDPDRQHDWPYYTLCWPEGGCPSYVPDPERLGGGDDERPM